MKGVYGEQRKKNLRDAGYSEDDIKEIQSILNGYSASAEDLKRDAMINEYNTNSQLILQYNGKISSGKLSPGMLNEIVGKRDKLVSRNKDIEEIVGSEAIWGD